MFTHLFENVRFTYGSAEIQLPRPHLILDPRVSCPNDAHFNCHYHDDGITVTITTDHKEFRADGDFHVFTMRVYDPAIETIPDFDSTIYTYMGRYDECAPADTTIGIIDPSVKIITWQAFMGCMEMKKCIMHGGVETIEESAFLNCLSLDALFLPAGIKKIRSQAFDYCTNIRILSIPTDIDISQIGRAIISGCHTFFRITQIPTYDRVTVPYYATNHDQVHQALIDFYRNVPPLHRACLDINVSPQTMHDCIIAHGTQAASIIDHDGMTPLHILSLNPHATVWSIKECFDADKSAALMEDNRGNTPLDYFLRENNLDAHTLLVASLCVHREAYSSSIHTSNKDGLGPSLKNKKNKRKRGM